jgi:hypothetical protein
VRPRSANEWRSFWHQGGEAGLRDLLREIWQPLHGADAASSARPAERIASLLASNAPLRALVSELGRIRQNELGAPPDAESDQAVATRVLAWFHDQP